MNKVIFTMASLSFLCLPKWFQGVVGYFTYYLYSTTTTRLIMKLSKQCVNDSESIMGRQQKIC